LRTGAYPPDLSLIVKARVGADNYLMALLTGYRCIPAAALPFAALAVAVALTRCRDAPAGITVEEGKHYNPYFPGGVISMKQVMCNLAFAAAVGHSCSCGCCCLRIHVADAAGTLRRFSRL
jgi:cytochrome c1